jgi:hypothetical protein
MSKAPRAPKPPSYSKDHPLLSSGTAPSTLLVPVAAPSLRRAALRIARWVPWHSDTRRGRGNAQLFKLVVVVVGGLLALRSGTPSGLALGAALALSATVLPLPALRRNLWLRRIEDAGQARAVARRVPAELSFDGRKLSVRVDGRVWRSARCVGGEHTLVVGSAEGKPAIGFLHKHGGAQKSLWVVGPVGSAPPALAPLRGSAAGIDAAVEVGEAAFAELRAAVEGAASMRSE